MTLIPSSNLKSSFSCQCPAFILLNCTGHSWNSLEGNNNVSRVEVIITECYSAHGRTRVGVIIFFLIMLEWFRTNLWHSGHCLIISKCTLCCYLSRPKVSERLTMATWVWKRYAVWLCMCHADKVSECDLSVSHNATLGDRW